MLHSTTAAHGLPNTIVYARVQAHTEQADKEACGKAAAKLAFPSKWQWTLAQLPHNQAASVST